MLVQDLIDKLQALNKPDAKVKYWDEEYVEVQDIEVKPDSIWLEEIDNMGHTHWVSYPSEMVFLR